MSRKFLAALTLGLTLATVPQAAHATLLAYSGLDTTSSTLHGVNDGFGWGNAWQGQMGTTNDFNLNPASLTFGTLNTTGQSVNGGKSFNTAYRYLDTDGPGSVFSQAGLVSSPWITKLVDQGTLWFSALAKVNSSLPSWDSTSLSFFNGLFAPSSGDLSISAKPGDTWKANSNGGPSASTGVPVVAGQTVLLVAKFNFTTGGFYLWAFNDPSQVTLGGADLAEGSAMAALTGLTVTNGMDFRSFTIYPGNSTGQVEMDEFRFGTTFADVTPPIPEPASLALLAAGGLLLIGRRHSA